ncbi:MAG: hypothetical protein Barrevirus20_2 [Barrevirus sp.]|uniref:Uncharacterized protein n=1 Tax=Barrevirus sp. TaxID=2487763 RepID=A0A3G4ZSD5_9VIRU|nr:MAG: hypothetical protein Barrevirus20_2 [Barrevirus sp.]
MYREPANSPFVPQIQKDLELQDRPPSFYQVKDDQFPPKKTYPPNYPTQGYQGPKQDPIVDLKVWQPKKPPSTQPFDRSKMPPVMYMPIPGQTPYFPPQFNPEWPYFYNPQVVSPVVKQFSINNGPFVNYSTLSVIKEDSLPIEFSNTANTLGERINIHNFVRSVFIRHHDGEDIDLDGKGKNSLLSYLKFMQLNPYSTSNSKNPYVGLPDGMVIYRSCYPIRYDSGSNAIQCAPNSLGLNIRIYRLTDIEYGLKKQVATNFFNYNVWREIAFYEYIREQILKRKICPNFIMMYCYYIAEKANIDFEKVKVLRSKDTSLLPDPARTTNLPFVPLQPVLANQVRPGFCKAIVMLSEAPTYSIYGWSSKTYLANANIHKMVNTGYHVSEVWISILFQLIVALYTMQIHGIAFTNFSIEDNVYVKDISQHENVVMYWKYKINEFEYYVPNYGYLLMIDSNYKDVENIVGVNPYKIQGSIFGDTNDNNEISKLTFEAFKRAINPNSFDKAFTNSGGTKPPSDIMELIKRIYNESAGANANQDISYYIYSYMGNLLNNRVGTYLSELELKNVRREDAKSFSKGQIVVQEVQNETYKFVIFVGQDQNSGISTILTKEDPTKRDIIEAKVPKDVLFSYSRYDNVVQNYRPMVSNLNEDELLETYVVGK